MLFSTNSYAVRYYVNYQAAGNGTGTSWANAFTTLTAALTKSVSGDEIWVAKGAYSPGGLRTDFFTLKTGVQLYGGFSGTETAVTGRVIGATGLYTVNETQLDGGYNNYHVVYSAVANTFIDGFTIQGGNTLDNAVTLSANYYGGGLYVTNTGTFQNLWIKNNYAATSGAGVYNTGTGIFRNMVVENNTMSRAGNGGGIYNAGVATFQQISINNNSGAAYGGGMYNIAANPQVSNISFKTNNASINGGGLFSTVAMTLDRVSFIENTSVRSGGGYYSTGVVTLNNTVFSRNSVTGVSSSYLGGGMYVVSGTVNIYNTTFSNNTIAYAIDNALSYGAGLYSAVTTVNLYNSILWGNRRGWDMPDQVGAVKIGMDYDIVEGGYVNGTNIIIGDPAFENAGINDLRLKAGSLGIDVGRNVQVGTSFDMAGNKRIVNAAVDMGAYEHPTGEAGSIAVMPKTFAIPKRGVPYSVQLVMAGGTGAAVTWEKTYGSIPLGLTLNKQTGVLSGTPAVAETAVFVVRATQGTVSASRQYVLTPSAGVTRLYVNANATGNNSGTDFSNGFIRLQTALDVAVSGDEIWVSKGAYYTANSVDSSFTLVSGVKLYGGFAGTETLLTQRALDVNKRLTINESILTGNGISKHVIANKLVTSANTLIDGFTIQDGVGSGTDLQGGGIYVLAPAASGIYRNLVVRRNSGGLGAGMYNVANNVSIENVLFEGNVANVSSKYGGGLYNAGNSLSMTDLTFRGNQAAIGGGMFLITGTGVVLNDALFDSNNATSTGGGLYNNSSGFLMNDAVFQGNVASAGLGGGMSNLSPATINRTVFRNNSATSTGGGLSNTVALNMDRVSFIANISGANGGGFFTTGVNTLSNMVFSRNSVTGTGSYGGGMYSNVNGSSLTNATFSNNTVTRNAINSGGGLFSTVSLAVSNSIFWNNSRANGVLDQINAVTANVTYSTVQDGFATGTNILVADPLFKDAGIDSLMLKGGSLSVDKGYNVAVGTTLDIAGNQRIYNDKVDHGAYEDQGEGSIKITPSTLGVITRGIAVNIQLIATRGTAPYTWNIVSGTLPPGLSLTADGRITGVPTTVQAGGYTFAISATDGVMLGTNQYTITPVQAPVRFYVRQGLTTGNKDGSTWANAFTDFTEPLKVVVAGDEIWVAKGSYSPGTTAALTFTMKEGVKWYGGFAGTETALTQRIADSNGLFSVNETILDGGNINNHVVYNAVALTNATVIDGFSIANGRSATGSNSGIPYSAGGIYNNLGSAVFKNLWIKNNKAYYWGGGMYNNAPATLENIRFEQNSAKGDGSAAGGGLYSNNGSATLSNLTFVENEAPLGGGMTAVTSAHTINNVTFLRNISTVSGGGLNSRVAITIKKALFDANTVTGSGGGIWNSSTLTGEDLVFKNNTSTITGAGIYNSGTLTLDRASFIANISRTHGGGIYNITNTSKLDNVIFSRNEVTTANTNGYGAGFYLASGNANLTNTTFSNNKTAYITAATGAGFFRAGGTATIYNSIFWGNKRGGDVADQIGGMATVFNSVVQDGFSTGTNIRIGDPLFTDATTDKLQIKGGSSAMDGGENAASRTTLDLDLKPRLVNDVVDMGAYENQGGESLNISPKTLVVQDRGTVFTQQFTATGGTQNLTWNISSGDLPPGMTFSNSGLLTGRLMTTGTYTFVVSATDGQFLGAKQFTVNVNTVNERIFASAAATNGAKNGTSWANAHTDLQAALDQAISGDEIWVAKGSYSPGALVSDNFKLKSGVKIYGGFAGNEESLAGRDTSKIHTLNSAVLTGNQGAGNYHVVYNVTAVSNETLLDGFTISGGRALTTTTGINGNGGGIYTSLGNPVFNNLRINDNVGLFGAGVYIGGGSPQFTNTRIFNNSTSGASGRAAGMYVLAGSIVNLNKVSFEGNTVGDASATYGGAILNYGTLTISDGLFKNNSVAGTTAQGGAIYNNDNAVLKITSTSFIGNSGLTGGAIYIRPGVSEFTDVVFKENKAAGTGGAVNNLGSPVFNRVYFIANEAVQHGGALFSSGVPKLDNVVFSRNKVTSASTYYGGAMYSSTATLTNVTFSNNSIARTAAGGGALYRSAGTITINNSIFWGNTRAGNISDQISGVVTINKSIVQDGYATGTNIGIGDPLFLNAAIDNLRLKGGSPAIDQGDNSKTTTNVDVLGNNRLFNGIVDLGAYENQGTASLTVSPVSLDAVSRGTNLQLPLKVNGDYIDLSWNITSGALPLGVSLSPAGVLMGRPLIAGTYTFVVGVTNGELVGSKQYTLVVNPGATIIFVNTNAAAGLNNGSNWQNGFTDLKVAISNAVAGDQVWVAKGTYSPGLLVTDTYAMKEGVKIYGGFAGTEVLLTERDMKLIGTSNKSVLDGSQGVASRHVIFNNVALSNATLLDGFTVSGGQASLTGTDGDVMRGGGIYNISTVKAIFSNLRIVNNKAQRGGGIYNAGQALFDHIEFYQNTSSISGAGMFNTGASVTMTDIVFRENTAANYGGGMASSGTAFVLDRVSFIGNSSAFSGAGFYLYGGAAILNNVLFSRNAVTTSGYYGGGMATTVAATLTNVTFSNNTTAFSSGTAAGGGGLYRGSGVVTVDNSIFWGNKRANGVDDQLGPNITLRQSIVQGGYTAGTNVFIGDPLFADAAADNLQLKGGSPAIDIGDNSRNTTSTDLSGNLRVFNETIDLGAYENQGGASLKVLPATIATVTRGTKVNIEMTVTGGTGDLTWRVQSGKLPGGLMLSSNGKLMGAATTVGTYIFVVAVTDGNLIGSKQYTVNVSAGAARLYVSQAATGENTGSDWANAMTDLQPALSLAAAGDEIWVAKGTYSAGTLASSSFTLKEGVKMYGGFAGTESILAERDSAGVRTLNQTILDGSQGTVSAHVVYNSAALTNATVLDGFSIQGGQTTGYGGGIYNTAGAATFSHLWVKNNVAVFGGGLYHSGDAVYSDVIFSDNQAKGSSARGAAVYNIKGFKLTGGVFENNRIIDANAYGAGIFNVGVLTLKDVKFDNNTLVGGQGGAIYSYSGAVVEISKASFNANKAGTGGAIYFANGTQTLTDIVFKENSATLSAGAIFGGGALTVNRASFIKNTAVQHGGAMWAGGASTKVDNTIFSQNSVTKTANYGGAVYASAGNISFINTTFSNNTIIYENSSKTLSYGGALYRGGGTVAVYNSILWGNTRGAGIADQLNAGIAVDNSIVQNDYAAGTGIKIGNPAFTDAGNDNLKLRPGSLAIDAGLNNWQVYQTDLAGNARVVNSVVDLGAYENDGSGSLLISPASIAPVKRGAAFDVQLTARGSALPLNWILKDGKLPPGISFSATGRLQGVPTATGNYTFVTGVSDGEIEGNKQYTITVQAGPSRLYVHQTATGANNGVSWANALTDLQAAIGLSVAGDEIWVAKGTYSPGPAVTSYFLLKDGVKIYGGFAGTETLIAERDSAAVRNANETILEGGKSQGPASYHVVYNNAALTSATVLDGFSIQGGAAGTTNGGGIYNSLGTATFNFLWIKNNTAVYGGGLYHSGDAKYTNIIFTNNQSKGSNARGAGVYNVKGFKLSDGKFDSNKIIETTGYGAGIFSIGILELNGVKFDSNSIVNGQGGAIYSNSGAATTISKSSFTGNTAPTGGALLITNGSTNMTDVVFANNAATATGGAIYVNSGMILNRVSFIDNTSLQHGAAMWTSGTLRIDNSIFSNNKVTSTGAYYGGAIYVGGGNTLINNSSFSNNSIAYPKVSPTLSYGGGIYRAGGVLTIHNSILWGNKRGGNVADQLSAGAVIDNSIVENNYATGTDVKIGDPLFVNPEGNDLRIKAGSLAIDAGINSWQAFDKDLDGKARVVNAIIDLGAYESNGGAGLIISPATLGPIVRGIYMDVPLSTTGSSALAGWTLEAGELPKGLALTSDGRLRGTPTVVGTYTFVLKASDGSLIGNRQYKVVVSNGIGRLYVAQAALGDNNGSNWANAFTDLQPALALATKGDEIWVAKGTYSAGPLATSSFILKEGVKIYGGFAGIEATVAERDTTLTRTVNETILDGSAGVASYHVVYNNNTAVATALTNATVLDGFSIQGGGSLSNYGSSYTNTNTFGGGIYNVGGAAVFSHLWIKNNLGSYGAGLYHSGDARYSDIRFTNNRSTGSGPRGAGVYNARGFNLKRGFFENNRIIESTSYTGYGAGLFNAGPAELSEVKFENNTITNGQGGAIYGYGSLTINDGSFTGNEATTGAAMYITGGIPVLSRVSFRDNMAKGGAGAIYVSGGMTIDRGSFINNTAVLNGGAVWSAGTLNISNSIFSRNKVTSTAANYGGAVYINSGTVTLTHNTFSNNSINYFNKGPLFYGGAVFRYTGTVTINNSVLWGNTRNSGTADQLNATVKVNNSLVQGAFSTGVKIIDKDPAFVNAETDDLALTGCSPAINTGDNLLATAAPLDFIGNGRKKSVQVDMGAFEYQNEVLVLNPSLLPAGTRGELYTQQLTVAGSSGTPVFQVISGKLPDGLSMTPSGLLTGNPFVIGKFTFTVNVSDGILCGNAIYSIDIVAGTGVVRMHVNQAAVSGADNGSNWANGYLDLQSALKVALAGDEIWVAKGSYSPGTLVTSTYKLIEGVKIYGGFAATEKTLTERDSSGIRTVNETILDGKQISRHVVYNNLVLTNAAVLDGFTITGGKAGTTGGNGNEIYSGGGIYNAGKGAAIFRNLWIKGNSATSYGGGMFNSGAAVLSNITFENNTVLSGSYQQGGGLFNNGLATLNNIEFIGNKASTGGGMFTSGTGVTMNNILFRENVATANGGGLNSYVGKVLLNNASFIGNISLTHGAGIYQYNSALTVTNTIFTRNRITSTGGYFGAAYYQYTGTVTMANITAYKNTVSYVNGTAAKYGAGISKNAGTLNLQNSILWNNTRGNSVPDQMNSTVKAVNTLVEGGYVNGTVIVDKDPLFNLATEDDLSLSDCSPAINMGDNTFSSGISKDILNNARIKAETVDLGAYENQKNRIIITPATLPEGARGVIYEQQLTAGGGAGNYTYTVSYGKLPDGLLLTSSGQIKGRPINAGTYTFNVNASDGNLCGNRLYTVNVVLGTGRVRIYVNQAATAGMNNSSNWENGFLDLQKGITSALAGDTIWVAKGNYSPGSLVSSSFILKEGVKIYGGFAATENDLSERDTTAFQGANETILNGGNKSYHVVYNRLALTKATVLDGFTIMGGRTRTSSSSYEFCGGGIMNYQGSIIFRNLWVKDNTAYYYGGGIYSNTASEFTNITLENNTVSVAGGGLSNLGASKFTNIKFINNKAQQGGGLHNRTNDITLNNVSFTGNTTTGQGGAFYTIGGNVVIKGATFLGNSAGQSGGAIYKQSGALTLYNAVFSRNKVTSTAGYLGGAIYSYTAATDIINSSFSNNSIGYANTSLTTRYGGAVYRYSGTVGIANSIFWGNRRGNTIADQFPAGITVSNSTIENGYVTGVQILTKDPQFKNAAADDLSLASCSPSINMGDNSKVTSITQDVAGGERIKHTTVDIGAYEFQGVYLENAEQTLPDADQWSPYTHQITLAESGAYTYTVSQGLLPDGLSITSTGKITGEASVAGLYEFTLAVNGTDVCGSLKVKMRVLAKEAYIVEVLTPYPVPVKKDTGTPFEELNLVTTVEVVMSDKTHKRYPVTWQAGNYNGTVEGIYTLTGVLTVPSPAVNKNNLLATAKVAVVDPVYPYIVSIEQLPPVYVLSGTPFNEVQPILPKQVKVTYDTGTTDLLNLVWRVGTYDLKAGIYRVYAEILLKEEHANPVGFEANLDIYAQQHIIAVEELADVTVPLHTAANVLPLPAKVRVTYHDQTTGFLNVDWDKTPYVADKGAEYDLKGIFQLNPLVSNTSSLYAANKIIIRKNIVSVNPLTGVNTAYDTDFDDVLLPQQVRVVFDDTTTDTVGVEWKPGTYNQKVSGNYPLSGILLHDESIDNTSGKQAAIVLTVLPKPKNIVSVAVLDTVHVGYGTLLTAVQELKLPVQVTYDDGTTGNLAVVWDTEGYDAAVTGDYTFTGDFTLIDGVINKDALTVDITVSLGLKSIKTVQHPGVINVPYGTVADEIDLPENVNVTYNDNTAGTEGVIWASETYNPLQEGSYIFKGTIANSELIGNPDSLFATVTVNVGPKPLTVVSAVVDSLSIPYGTSFKDAVLLFPKTALVTYDNGTTGQLNVIWKEGDYDGMVSGSYLIAGTLELMNNVVNPDSVHVELKATVGVHMIQTYTPVPVVNVAYGTATADLILPETVNTIFADGGNQELGVTWDLTNFNGSLQGKYLIKGTFNLTDDIQNPNLVIPQMEVNVAARPKLVVTLKTDTILVGYGKALADILFPVVSKATLDEGTMTDLPVLLNSFEVESYDGIVADSYDGTEAGTYLFEGVVSPPDGIQNPENITPKVLVVVGKRSIETLTPAADMTVAYGTAFESLTLPESVRAIYNDLSEELLAVNWTKGDYDGNLPGVYTLQGTLVIPEDIDNPKGLQPVIKVTVAEKIRTLVSISRDSLSVAYGTELAMVNLPATVTGLFDDGSTEALTVTEWKSLDYDSLEAGNYVFYGMVAMPVNTVNPEEIKAVADVMVQEKYVVSVAVVPDLVVPFGTLYDDLTLPVLVNVTYNNNAEELVPVNWNTGNFNGLIPGDYTLQGTLVTDPAEQNKDNKEASIKVTVLPKLLNIDSAVFAGPLHLPIGKTMAQVLTALGTQVKVIYTDLTEGTAGVSWESALFNGNLPGTYNFTGLLIPAAGAANPDDVKIKAEVIIDRKNVISVEQAVSLTDVYGKQFNELELPSTVKVTYDDKTSEMLPVSWSDADYKSDVFTQQTLSGEIQLTDEVTNTLHLPGIVKITLYKDVESVDSIPPVRVSYGAPLGGLNLPATILVTFNDGSKELVPVVWDEVAYTTAPVGTLDLTGTLTLPPNVLNTNLQTALINMTIEKVTQTITFEMIADKVYGDAPFRLVATASSGLPVNFVLVTGAVDIAADMATIRGAGEVTIKAVQLGNASIEQAEALQRFTIEKALLLVSGDSLLRYTGVENPPLTYQISGFKYEETDSLLRADGGLSGTPALSTTATMSSIAGLYQVLVEAGDLDAINYDFDFVPGLLTLKSNFHTVTWDTKGGTAIAPMEVEDGTTITPAVTTKDGVVFYAWFSDETMETAYNFDSPVTEDITLYADWQIAPLPPTGPISMRTIADYMVGLGEMTSAERALPFSISLLNGKSHLPGKTAPFKLSAWYGYGQLKRAVLKTIPVSGNMATGVTAGVEVVNTGGSAVTAVGLCWTTSGNPTITDSKTTAVLNGSSATAALTNLVAGTKYYLKAYATTAAGTAYGNLVVFTIKGDGLIEIEKK
ncbi:Ig-like domain-containing protein [Pedobacter sp. MR2016-24]|uniref:Ig-like domain-containing protein n=1 Tax=Pedobacter sp. MR2016-24 TaxID=2994466 RepID=UPI0022484579|nr:Ig-like domain-containing protein [Pedobacter sp. MR2016-24]MCX2482583.1 Ig-like domain-containing protein [Pedobacter sp. MR2016-24]